jgi:hypothetical protein
MSKQVYNTRGKKIETIKEILCSKVANRRVDISYRIARLQESLDYELFLKDKNEREISYLEKFIERKEKIKNENTQVDI